MEEKYHRGKAHNLKMQSEWERCEQKSSTNGGGYSAAEPQIAHASHGYPSGAGGAGALYCVCTASSKSVRSHEGTNGGDSALNRLMSSSLMHLSGQGRQSDLAHTPLDPSKLSLSLSLCVCVCVCVCVPALHVNESNGQ